MNIGARLTVNTAIRPSSSPRPPRLATWSALIAEEYGGIGFDLGAAAVILEKVHALGDSGAACHAQMYTGAILRHGSDAQKERYLPLIASGELRLQAFGVTEPTSGTDALSLRGDART